MNPTILTVLLAACSEYGLQKETDALPGTDTDPPSCDAWTPSFTTPSADHSCFTKPDFPDALDAIVEWRTPDTWEVAPASINVTTTPVVGDLDGDGLSEIVFATYEEVPFPGVVRAIRGDGSQLLWSFDTPQGDDTIDWESALALGDVDGDGVTEVLATTDLGGIVCLDGPTGTLEWYTRFDDRDVAYHNWLTPAVADLEGDGTVEILLGNMVLDGASGQILTSPKVERHGGIYGQYFTYASSIPVDLDLDGTKEIVAGTAIVAPDGTLLAQSELVHDGFPAVGDFDADPHGEVVIVDPLAGTLHLYDYAPGALTEIWQMALPGKRKHTWHGGPPTVADFDADGQPEIGVAGPEHYAVIDTDGTLLWAAPTSDLSSSFTGSSVFDFEGDGTAEVIYGDEHTLWIFDGATGEVRWQDDETASRTRLEYPVVADVDGDGSTEVVYAANTDTYPTDWPGLTVIGSASDVWAPARPIWNQYAYSITNVEDDGGIPIGEAPSFTGVNTFRAAGLGNPQPWAQADLTVEVQTCLATRTEDAVEVAITVHNQGLATATDAGAVTLAATEHWMDLGTIAPGESAEPYALTLTRQQWGTSLAVTADPAETIEECDEGNTVLVGPWPCE